jgi:ferrous iron transport protein B
MQFKIALAGNPNTGKTTLFNALTGSNQFVGNWPGVTVEKKEGTLIGHSDVLIQDLPGIYSLSPYTLEEVVSRTYLVKERPDAILNIVDGTNLERNLYLTTQLMELGIPVIMAVNMMDVVKASGDIIHTDILSQKMGCPVMEISARTGKGIKELADFAARTAKHQPITEPKHEFSGPVEHALAHIEEAMQGRLPAHQERWYAVKLFERDSEVQKNLKLPQHLLAHIDEDIKSVENELDDDAESIITNERYTFVSNLIAQCFVKKDQHRLTTSDKIDRIVTNRFLALPIFAVIMFLVYYVSVTTIGTDATDWVNDTLFGEIIVPGAGALMESWGVADWLKGLVVDGIISGVGAVLGFVPQMVVLFIFLAFLEACGYMARIAFILDRAFRKFGLSGKSFIPMLIGSGCGVPGIMASRTIENQADRRMTIMTTTMIPCSAKMPIIALVAGAYFGGEWWVAPSAYFVGVAAIIVSGIILKKTKMFAGDPAPFIMELPAYHMPTLSNIARSVWERSSSFIKKAGTVILLSTILIWFLSSFGFGEEGFGMVEDLNDSVLSAIGQKVAWIFTPLGWGDWKAAVATFTGLIAKENLVGTFGILYGLAEASEEGEEFWGTFAQEFSVISAYSFLIFNLLCAPCVAAMGAIRREMNSTKWWLGAIGYQCGFAYCVALCFYQFAQFLSTGVFGIGTGAACIITAFLMYLLFRPAPKYDNTIVELDPSTMKE